MYGHSDRDAQRAILQTTHIYGGTILLNTSATATTQVEAIHATVNTPTLSLNRTFVSSSSGSMGPNGGGSGLSNGAIAGIVVGCVVGACCIILLIVFFCSSLFARQKSSTSDSKDVVSGPNPYGDIELSHSQRRHTVTSIKAAHQREAKTPRKRCEQHVTSKSHSLSPARI